MVTARRSARLKNRQELTRVRVFWRSLSSLDACGGWITYFALDIDLKGVSVERFMDRTTWTVREEDLLRTVTQAGGATQYGLLTRSMANLPPADPWRVANGHDMIHILRMGLLQVLGTMKTNVDANQVARVLRAAIALEDLDRTGFGAAIRTWEAYNEPYRVFRQ